jgi:trypsin
MSPLGMGALDLLALLPVAVGCLNCGGAKKTDNLSANLAAGGVRLLRFSWTERLRQLIIGGSQVNGGFDFVAALKERGAFKGGGTVLPRGWVLTAAHLGAIDQVIAGRPLLSSTTGHDLQVENCYCHKDYSGPDRLVNDIALIKLRNPPPDLATIAVAADDQWENTGAVPLTLLGWGNSCGKLFKQLCKGQVKLVDQGTCAQDYTRDGQPFPIDSMTLCTDVSNAGSDDGDSGGPVLAEIGGQMRLVGVISTGASVTVPNRHMKVTSYLDWIHKVMGGDITQTRPCGT